jgi:hypothetical protein
METSSYWERRKNLLYFRYVDYMVCAVGANATSLIDVGSHNCEYLTWFPWIQDMASLDIRQPFEAPSIRSIKADFFEWEPDKKYDVALCLQVLEHIDDAPRFAAKLLTLANNVIVSVPYKWAEASAKSHVHDPIDRTKFNSWFPVEPDYSVVVTEPFSGRNGKRMVSYFDTQAPGSKSWAKTRPIATKRMSLRRI